MFCLSGHTLGVGQRFCSECGAPAAASIAPPYAEAPPTGVPLLPPPEALPGGPDGGERSRVSKRVWLGVTATLVVVLGGGGAAVVLTLGHGKASSEPGVQTWLCTFSDGQILLQWPNQGGAIVGTYQHAVLTGQAPGQSVQASNGTLRGQLSGNSITANIGPGDWYGTVKGTQMTLNIPREDGTIRPEACVRSSTDAWNQSLATLNSQASSANAAANAQIAQQQQAADLSKAQQSLTSDVAGLANDAHALDTDTSLGNDVTSTQHDLAAEQSAWTAEQADQCSNLYSDAGTIGADAGVVGAGVSTLNADISSVSNRLTGIQQDTSAVESDLSSIQSLGGTPATNPAAALTSGKKTAADTQKAISWGNQQATDLTNQSQAITNQASNYATAHAC